MGLLTAALAVRQAKAYTDAKFGTVSVAEFGAVGDGVADDTAAIQAAIDSGAESIYLPPGTYNVRCLQMARLDDVTGVTGYKFHGAGATTVIRIIGTDDDAYTVTDGTSTLSANLVFYGRGESKPYVGGFTVIGNRNVSNGLLFYRFFRGSFAGDIFARDFKKPGAVPFTFMNCVSTYAPNLVGDHCSRFIRLHGMADAVRLEKPTIYNCDAGTYSQIFNEVGYLDENNPTRYTVGTTIDSPYCFRDTDASVVVPGVFIHLVNANKCRINDVWAEAVDTSVLLENCQRIVIHNALASVSGVGTSKVVVSGGYSNFIDTEGAVDLGDSIENVVISRTGLSVSSFQTDVAAKNIVIAKDEMRVGRRLAVRELVLTSPNGTRYAVTVDDDGTLSASAL